MGPVALQGVSFQPVQIDLAQKPGFFSQVSPSGLVPVVAFRGSVIAESLDICRWVDESLKGPSLVPQDRGSREAMDSLVAQAGRISSAGLDLLAGRTGR